MVEFSECSTPQKRFWQLTKQDKFCRIEKLSFWRIFSLKKLYVILNSEDTKWLYNTSFVLMFYFVVMY